MVYDSNGFNFNGNSIITHYNTTLAGDMTTRTSGFSMGNADIATLISPAVDGATAATSAAGAYTGFGEGLDFDVAFSYLTIPGAKVDTNDCDSTVTSGEWKIMDFRSSNKVFSIVFPATVAGSATATSQKLSGNITGYATVVGGGGGGGSNSTGGNAGTGGGGAGALVTSSFAITEDITFNISIGGGGGGGVVGSYGSQGASSTLYGGTNRPSVTAYGGTGGGGTSSGYWGDSRTYNGLSGSTGGSAGNHNNIDHTSQAYRLSTTSGGAYENTITTNIDRHRGGDDLGYGLSGAGGGGAGADGGVFQGDYKGGGGDGGAGLQSWDRYLCGGGGGLHSYGGYAHGAGGLGGGGAGGTDPNNATGGAGTNNTGGGGGGGWDTGGAGGSGLVMLIFSTNTGIFD